MGSALSSKSYSPEKMSQIKDLVDAQLASNENIVYSKTFCPYCTKAKNELHKLNIKYKLIELDQEPEGDAIQQYLAQKTGQRTVPNIFLNSAHVGGCDDLIKSIKSGQISKSLAN
ncbi:hypothetical protein BB561_003063 [Smittium simulii]|uniref:Glutaredoxin domain-containing protein n=1 Tax=Smittium simulii TaxID=133385 RepID=A0A2T9YN17_9FUNG|nr:hypothetical protein BB561_003063 [Smittium simulii]